MKRKIEKVWEEHPSYGHKRLATALKLNRKRILRVMKLYSLKPYRRHRKPWKRVNSKESEYTAKIFQDFCIYAGINISMSAKGSPWQNGYQESFYDKFKVDLGDPNRFDDLGELVYEIYHTIHVYNTSRIHTSLGMSPREFAKKFAKKIA